MRAQATYQQLAISGTGSSNSMQNFSLTNTTQALIGTNTPALLLTKQQTVPQLSAHQFNVCLFVIAFTERNCLLLLFSDSLTSLLVPMRH